MTQTKTPSIYSLKFCLLCTSSFLFSCSFNMLLPELPAYLSSLGGGAYKGYIIALFTLTAGLSRPFSGRLTDTIGRVPVMAIGSLVCFICGLLYPLLTTISGFLVLRLFHGFSTGFKPTATAAYIADIIPQHRWGEAMGIHGLCFSTGLAIGPAIGGMITAHHSINFLFVASSLFALLSILILLNVKETHPDKERFHFALLKMAPRDLIAPQVLPAAIVTFLGYISYGAILTLIPDWSAHLGLRNKGTFFIMFTLSSLLVRIIAGKVSDKKGRVYVLRIALALIMISVFILGWAPSMAALLTGAFMYGIAVGFFSPATSAWTTDLSHPAYRGRAMATMYIALEAGIGSGALVAGWVFKDQWQRIPYIFYGSAIVAFMGLLYVLLAHTRPIK